MPDLTDAEVRVLRLCAHEAAYGNPAEFTDPALLAAAESLRERGFTAWAGRHAGAEAYEWTDAGSTALAAHDDAELAAWELSNPGR